MGGLSVASDWRLMSTVPSCRSRRGCLTNAGPLLERGEQASLKEAAAADGYRPCLLSRARQASAASRQPSRYRIVIVRTWRATAWRPLKAWTLIQYTRCRVEEAGVPVIVAVPLPAIFSLRPVGSLPETLR